MDGKLFKILIIPVSIILFSAYFSLSKNNFFSSKNSTGEASQVFSSQNFQSEKINILINNQTLSLEVAKTPQQLQIGLMNRTSLDQNSGMIFIFPQSQVLSFWMKNTLIPLDIIFLDKDFKVLNIETAYPQPGVADQNLKSYVSNSVGKYVIELNAGRSQSLGLKPGDKINIDEKNL